MSESKWEWMKRNQRRFANNNASQSKSLPVSPMLPSTLPSPQKPTGQVQQNLPTKSSKGLTQPNLDAFIKPKSSLFDETFSIEDFRLLTKRWKAEQNIMN